MNAFWSLTMYDGKTQLLIENPINRYLINSPMLPDLEETQPSSSNTMQTSLASNKNGKLTSRAQTTNLITSKTT